MYSPNVPFRPTKHFSSWNIDQMSLNSCLTGFKNVLTRSLRLKKLIFKSMIFFYFGLWLTRQRFFAHTKSKPFNFFHFYYNLTVLVLQSFLITALPYLITALPYLIRYKPFLIIIFPYNTVTILYYNPTLLITYNFILL